MYVRYIISSSLQWWSSSSCHYCYHHRIIILLSSSYRYYYHHRQHHSRIIVAEIPARRARVHVWRRPAPGGGATATKHGRRNFTVCPTKRSLSRRKPDRTVRGGGGDVRYTSTWRGHRVPWAYIAGERCTRTKAMTFCGCRYGNSARDVQADRKSSAEWTNGLECLKQFISFSILRYHTTVIYNNM